MGMLMTPVLWDNGVTVLDPFWQWTWFCATFYTTLKHTVCWVELNLGTVDTHFHKIFLQM